MPAKKKKKNPAKKPPAKKPAAPSTDSTYQRQIDYFNKLAADFKADQVRKTAELASMYGTQAVPQVTRKSPFYNIKTKTVRKVGPKGKVRRKKVRYTTPVLVKDPKTGKMVQKYANNIVKKGKAATGGVYQRDLADTRKKDLEGVKDDYAARGILHSGIYARKNSDYETEYGKQVAEVTRKKTTGYADIASEARQFNRDQQLQKEQARLEAARRRAAQTGSFLK